MDYLEEINQNILLNCLSADEIARFLDDGSFRTTMYAKNNIVHYVGETCSKLEMILSGKVVIERIDEAGNLMSVAEVLSGDMIGGNLLFSANPNYPMTITAKQPTVILEIKKERLFELFSDNHAFLRRYLEFVSDHAVILGDRIKHYVNRSIRERVMRYLENERAIQNSDHIRLGITKKAIAEKIGAQRTSLSRELAKMREDGLIAFDGDSIDLLYNLK